MTIENIRKSPKYNKDFLQLVTSTFKNAWNYKAYKLPKWYEMTKYGDMGFEENIHLVDGVKYEACDKISLTKYIIAMEGIFEFAFGQPTEYEIYNKTLNDIQKRWEERLVAKSKMFEPKLKEIYPDSSIKCFVDTGDGDEGCVYPTIIIEVPLKYFKE